MDLCHHSCIARVVIVAPGTVLEVVCLPLCLALIQDWVDEKAFDCNSLEGEYYSITCIREVILISSTLHSNIRPSKIDY